MAHARCKISHQSLNRIYAVGLIEPRIAHYTTPDATDLGVHRLCDRCQHHGQVGAGKIPFLSLLATKFNGKLLIFSFAVPVDDRPRYDSISKSYLVEASRSVLYTLCDTCTLITPITHLMSAPWCSSSNGVIPLFSCPGDICKGVMW